MLRHDDRALIISWSALGLATLVLLWSIPSLPPSLPILREPTTGVWTAWAPTSLATALRVPAMGIGQAGAATIMLRAAQRCRARYWRIFWLLVLIVATLKTVVETLQIALLGAPLPSFMEPAFYGAALLPVLAGAGLACGHLWRRRRELESVTLLPSEVLFLCASLGLWFSFAAWAR